MSRSKKDSRQIFVLAILLIILTAGCTKHEKGKRTIIFGHFVPFDGAKIYLNELDIRQTKLVDSARIDKEGRFQFEWYPDEAGFYILRIDEYNYITLFTEPGETTELVSDTIPLQANYKVSGSEGSQLLREYFTRLEAHKKTVDSLKRVFEDSKYLPDFFGIKKKLDSVYETSFKNYRQYVIGFISENSLSPVSLFVINQKFGPQTVFDEISDFEYFELLDSVLMKAYPGNKHIMDHHERVENIREKIRSNEEADRRLAPGKTFPDITLPDTAGTDISLNELRNTVVLVYFWSGGNAKSRQLNPQLKELYKQYKDHNFEIYGISLDRNRKVWEGALALDNLPWINVSDLKGMGSPLVELFNIHENLPWFYLIDKDGMIILRTGSTEKVENRVAKIFQ